MRLSAKAQAILGILTYAVIFLPVFFFMMVVYGGLTGLKETSVGNLFAGAIIPGLLLSGLYFFYIYVRQPQTSFVTPPFGYALFYFAGVAPEGYTMMHIYKGILPFVVLQLIGLAILGFFPGLITWLPALFFGG